MTFLRRLGMICIAQNIAGSNGLAGLKNSKDVSQTIKAILKK
jgi:hypothetical protein